MWRRVARMVTVNDGDIAAAMRAGFDDTHNIAEGSGAVATVISGGNVDRELFAEVLRGSTV